MMILSNGLPPPVTLGALGAWLPASVGIVVGCGVAADLVGIDVSDVCSEISRLVEVCPSVVGLSLIVDVDVDVDVEMEVLVVRDRLGVVMSWLVVDGFTVNVVVVFE